MNAPTANIAKSACQHCGGNIEFDADQAGTDISCPHCGVVTRLTVAPSAPPAFPPKKLMVADGKKRIKRAYGVRAASGVLLIIGALMVMGGLLAENEAKSAFQEDPAFLLMCSGVIVMALAAIISALARVIEALENK